MSILSIKNINKYVFSATMTKPWVGFDFQSDFRRCFIVDLPMHHEFWCVNQIGISRTTQKRNQITPILFFVNVRYYKNRQSSYNLLKSIQQAQQALEREEIRATDRPAKDQLTWSLVGPALGALEVTWRDVRGHAIGGRLWWACYMVKAYVWLQNQFFGHWLGTISH